MSDFVKQYDPKTSIVDLYKRVRYSPGLVLGVDEFVQEQEYFMERDRLHSRALHGYGTVSGLQVTYELYEGAPTIHVTPGLAVNPIGQEIRVPYDQRANLHAWLSKQEGLVDGDLTVYVVLCYDECETDFVPVPTGPCRTQEESRVASRIAADYRLCLVLDKPQQVEEEAVVFFGDIINALRIRSGPDPMTPEELAEMVSGLITVVDEQTLELNPPTIPEDGIDVAPDDADVAIWLMYHTWVTEIRPRLLYNGSRKGLGPAAEHCVLLGTLDFGIVQVDADFVVAAPGDGSDPVFVNDTDRPLLLHTRFLQEWIANMQAELDNVSGPAGGDLSGSYPDPEVAGLRGQPIREDVGEASGGDMLFYQGESGSGEWIARNHFAGRRLINIGAATEDHHAVRRDQIIQRDEDFAGDVTGPFDDTFLSNIQRHPLEAEEPNEGSILFYREGTWVISDGPAEGQVLSYQGGQWQLIDPPSGGVATLGGDVTGSADSNTLSRIQGETLNAASPSEGELMVYQGGQWQLTGAPGDGQLLIFQGGQWQFIDPPSGGVTTLGGDITGSADSNTLSRIQGETLNAASPSEGELMVYQGGQWQLTGAPGDGQFLIFQGGQWQFIDPPSGGVSTLDGDVTGPPDNSTLSRIQGHIVNAASPVDGNALVFVGNQWVPQPLPDTGTGAQVTTLPFASIFPVSDLVFDIWFNIDAPEVFPPTGSGNELEIWEVSANNLMVQTETEDPGEDFVNDALFVRANRLFRNMFRVELDIPKPAPLLRFVFDLKGLELASKGEPLGKMLLDVLDSGDFPVRFVGQTTDVVTKYVRVAGGE